METESGLSRSSGESVTDTIHVLQLPPSISRGELLPTGLVSSSPAFNFLTRSLRSLIYADCFAVYLKNILFSRNDKKNLIPKYSLVALLTSKVYTAKRVYVCVLFKKFEGKSIRNFQGTHYLHRSVILTRFFFSSLH